jgi:hypothetical protein
VTSQAGCCSAQQRWMSGKTQTHDRGQFIVA